MGWANVQDNYSRWGALRALHISIMNLLGRLGIELMYVHTRPLIDFPDTPFEENGIQHRALNVEELEQASSIPELDISPDFLARALARGDLCCGAFHEDNLVSYVWRSGGEIEHVLGLKVVLAERCRYGYKAFTLPNYRGRGIYPKITGLVDREFLKRGKTTIVGFSVTHNYATISADKKLGNRIIGLIGYWKLGKHFLLLHTPGVKQKAFRFVRN